VSRLKNSKFTAFFASQYFLLLLLASAFFTYFALNRGGVNIFIEIGGLFLVLYFFLGVYPLKEISLALWIAAAICLYLILTSLMIAPQHPHLRWMKNLMRMLVVVFMIHCLAQKKIENWVFTALAALLALVVCWQFIAHNLLNMPYGTFSNKHYLATFAVLAFPALIYFVLTAPGWYRLFFLAICLIDAHLFLQIGSRTAYAGILFGGAFAICFLIKGRSRWIGLFLLGIASVIIYLTNYSYVVTRIKRLILNFTADERFDLWSKAWLKLQDNSLIDWIFGHGMGWFSITYTGRRRSELIFPHGHFLEIIYQNGLVGLIMIYGGLICLIVSAIIAMKRAHDRKVRFLLISLTVALFTWIIHSGLAFPIYSKNSLYPLAFILGPLLVLVGKENRRDSST